MLVGAGPLVAFAGEYGFGPALYVLSAILTLLAGVHAVLLARDSAQPTGPTKASVEPAEVAAAPTSAEAARAFLAQPLAITCIVLLLTYRAGDALLFAMNAKFLGSLGMDTTLRGVVNGTFGTAASIAGSILGGVVLARFSFRKLFVPITVLQSTAILLYHGLAHSGAHVSAAPSLQIAGFTVQSLHLISATVVIEQFIAGMGTAAFTSFILKLCHGRFKTVHFAFASSVMSVAAMGLGAASGYLYGSLGAGRFFFVAFLATLPGVLASLVVRLK
jgi:PAT family beta-lactamase induction signal transducer AmpG